MVKIANAAEDVDVMMTPRRSHVTKTKRPQTQPTPPQMILNFEETSAVADVDVATETLHENLLQMVKPVSLEMPPKSLVQMAKIANAAEDVSALMNPFLYPSGGPGAAGQNPLLAAAASQQIAYLAAIQNQANLLTQQLREQGVNPAMLQHALQQQQIQQQQQAALAAAAAGGHSLFPGMPPSAAPQFPGANPFAMHPAFNPYLAAVSAAGGFPGLPGATSMPPAVSIASASIPSIPTSVWTPPVGGVATPTPPNSNSSGQRETPTPTRTSHSGLSSPGYPASTSQSLATSMGSGHQPSLLRIKESVSPPPTSGAGSMDVKREGSQRQSSEAPLNLSMRPTSL